MGNSRWWREEEEERQGSWVPAAQTQKLIGTELHSVGSRVLFDLFRGEEGQMAKGKATGGAGDVCKVKSEERLEEIGQRRVGEGKVKGEGDGRRKG